LRASSMVLEGAGDREALLVPDSTIFEDTDYRNVLLSPSSSVLEGLPSPSSKWSHGMHEENGEETANASSIGGLWHAFARDGIRVEEEVEAAHERRSRWHSSVPSSGLSNRGHSIELQRSQSGPR
jgi:hypothetical protein